MTPPILGIWASQISGHLWEPAGAYDALATVTVPSGGLSSVTFANIPTGYKHLQIRGIAAASPGARLGISLNSDTTVSNYNQHFTYGDGTAGSGYNANAWGFAYTPANGSIFGGFVCDILDYNNVNKYKVWRSLGGEDQNGSGAIVIYSGLWRNTAAINTITIYGNETGTSGAINQYSTFALYGVK